MQYKIGVEIDGKQDITFFTPQEQTEGSISLSTISDYQTRAVLKIFLYDTENKYFLDEISIDNIPPEEAGKPKIDLHASIRGRYNLHLNVLLNDRFYKELDCSLKMFLKQPGRFKASLLMAGGSVVMAGVLLVFFISRSLSSGTLNQEGSSLHDGTTTKTGYSSSSGENGFTADKEQESASPLAAAQSTRQPTGTPIKLDLPDVTVTIIPYTQQTASPAAPTGTDSQIPEIRKEVVYFQPDRWEITPATAATLDKLLPYLKATSVVRIEGHCALFESEEERYEVSILRVKTVYAYLLSNGWKPAATPKLIGYGGRQPVTQQKERQHLNRRVEIILEK